MRELERRQWFKRRLYSWPVLFLFIFVTLISLKGAYGLMVKRSQSVEEVSLLNQKRGDLEKRRVYLEDELSRLNTEAGVEQELKSKFNVARAGERVALITEEKSVTTTTPAKLPWWKRWWGGIISEQ